MGLSITTTELKHTLKTKQKTFKMHGFEPQNMFTMMNNMMKDPEIQKFAKNFEEQMKNSMKDFQNSKNNETPNTTENSCPSSSSSPKTTENSCSSARTNNRKSAANSVSIPLRRFAPEQVQLNMNKNGLVTVTASRENTEESNRNGQRKTTIMIEETCQLPGYLVDNDLLKTVESKFHEGFLVLSYAEDPKIVEEREAEERKNAPIEIPIMMED